MSTPPSLFSRPLAMLCASQAAVESRILATDGDILVPFLPHILAPLLLPCTPGAGRKQRPPPPPRKGWWSRWFQLYARVGVAWWGW